VRATIRHKRMQGRIREWAADAAREITPRPSQQPEAATPRGSREAANCGWDRPILLPASGARAPERDLPWEVKMELLRSTIYVFSRVGDCSLCHSGAVLSLRE
jgi:hypothetical protein